MIFEYDQNMIVKPEYLTIDIFETILQNAVGIKQPKILKIKCSMGSTAGENYCSQIYRSKIMYKNENSGTDTLSVIIKSMPVSESADFLEPLDVCMKEKITYRNILPRLELLFDKSVRFGPRIYHCIFEPIKTLVFEDLNTLGYRMASRESGLDEVHTRLTLKRIAQFHAGSMVMAKSQPSFLKDFTKGILDRSGLANDNGAFMRFFGGCFKSLIELVESWPDYVDIARKLRKYDENFRENLIAAQADSVKDTFKVLNHGDLWVNNMLFKYGANGKDPMDVLFIDFQMSRWGSPGIDLNYFFYTSIQLELLKYRRVILLEYYHKELCNALKRLNAPGMMPTFSQIQTEFKNRAAHGFFANFGIFPVISMDKEETSDNNLDNFMDDDFARKKMQAMFQSKRLKETFRYTLREFDKLGIWDHL